MMEQRFVVWREHGGRGVGALDSVAVVLSRSAPRASVIRASASGDSAVILLAPEAVDGLRRGLPNGYILEEDVRHLRASAEQ